jgi:simple sugar transport system substrate-binding protein
MNSDRGLQAAASLRQFMRLPPAQRASVILMDVIGYSLEEVAGILETTVPAVKASHADPNIALPIITAAVLNNPGVKAIGYPGGQLLGNVPTYMQAAKKKPGEIFSFGFDTSPQIVEAFKAGWVQLTADQQPFLQGYLPVLNLCQQVVYGLGPINVDTGAGFVTAANYKMVGALATEGLR